MRLVFDREKELELAWAAGFWDGEGSTYCNTYKVNGKNYFRIKCEVTQNHKHILERFQSALEGLGKIYGPYKYNNQQGYYLWTTSSSKNSKETFRLLKPMLSDIKIKQFEIAEQKTEQQKDVNYASRG
jgi:hypothetical protein